MLLNALLDALFRGSSTSRRARRVIEHGERVTARIDAIRVNDRADSPDRWEYGLAVGTSRVGVRQWLQPARHVAHLGAEVVLLHFGDDWLIDWPASLAAAGVTAEGAAHHATGDWKTLGDPPAPGVRDGRLDATRKKLAGATATTARLRSAERSEGWSGLSDKWRLVLSADGREVTMEEAVPAYSLHLLEAGRALPAAWSGERLIIDWEGASD